MRRFGFAVLLAAMVASFLAPARTATPTAAAADVSAAAAPAAGDTRSSFVELRAEALSRLLSGDFDGGAATLEAALNAMPDDAITGRAEHWVSDYLNRRRADEADRRRDYDAAVAMAKALLAIARHADELAEAKQTEDVFVDVRKRLETVRELVVDLLAAPRIETNVTSDQWYADWLARDRAKIGSTFEAIKKDLAAEVGGQAEEIRRGMERLTEAMDAFAAEAALRPWGNYEAAVRSLDAMTDETELLAMAMDDLTALVSESPWRAAVERLRMVQQVAEDEAAILDEPWARDIIDGARRRAEALEEAREWYEALGLYSTLNGLYHDNGLYEDRVKYVMRRTRVTSLYGRNGAVKGAEPAADTPGTDTLPADVGDGAVVPADAWREHVRGVDAYMVRRALARIDETYVEHVDYRRALLGALRAVRVLAQSPELVETFEGLADEQAKSEFVDRLDALIADASKIEDMTYRMAGRSLNQVLWANRQTVQIPDEAVHVEFTDGFMKELDRFSTMIWPSEWPEFKKHTMGSFKGVGIQIQVQRETGLLMVVSPLANSPAYRAGIKAGDFIMAIDGADAKDIEIEEAVRRITGPEGTKVVLTIRRPGLDALLDKTLVREEIHIQTVKGWMRTDDDRWDWFIDRDNGIGYLRISSFNRDTSTELRQALAELRADGARGLILDLRGNPGGLLGAAVEVADEFLDEGTIVSTKNRQQRTGRLHADRSGGFLTGELVVLIDDRSASAAEIVSGALKDLGRAAVVVGQRSFGKGSVQNLIPIRQDPTGANDAFLKVTTAYYYLPSERCLHRIEGAEEWGVEPDISPTVTPRQLRRWLTLQRRTEVIKARDLDQLQEEMDRQFRADIQLDTALLFCRLRLLQNDLAGLAQATPARSDKAR